MNIIASKTSLALIRHDTIILKIVNGAMEGKKYKCGREHKLDRNSNIDLTAIISKTMQ